MSSWACEGFSATRPRTRAVEWRTRCELQYNSRRASKSSPSFPLLRPSAGSVGQSRGLSQVHRRLLITARVVAREEITLDPPSVVRRGWSVSSSEARRRAEARARLT